MIDGAAAATAAPKTQNVSFHVRLPPTPRLIFLPLLESKNNNCAHNLYGTGKKARQTRNCFLTWKCAIKTARESPNNFGEIHQNQHMRREPDVWAKGGSSRTDKKQLHMFCLPLQKKANEPR